MRSLSIIQPIRLAALLLLALAAGCGDDTPSMGDEGVEKEIAVSSPTFNIINILRATGNSVKVTGKADRPFFKNAKGYTMLVNNGVALEVYEFESAEELEQSATTVSADGANVEGKKVEWDASPHFYKTDKVIIIYVGNDADNQRELASVFGSQFAGR
jgi:hypothetical protein